MPQDSAPQRIGQNDRVDPPTSPNARQKTPPLKSAVLVTVAFVVIFPLATVALVFFTQTPVYLANVLGGLSTLAGLGALCIADMMGYWRREDDKTQATENCCHECREVQGVEKAALLARETARKDNFTYFGHIAVLIGATCFLAAFLTSALGI